MAQLDRRTFLAKLVRSAYAGPLTAERIDSTPRSEVWLIGPPGPALQKFIRCLAPMAHDGPTLWDDPKMANVVGSWYRSYLEALEKPLVFDDEILQGAIFTSARQKIENAARWAYVTLEWK